MQLLAVTLLARDHRVLQGYPYLLFLVGLALLLLPMSPLGVEINGSQIWIRVAGLSFQPAEVAKIVLSFAFAAYLAEPAQMQVGFAARAQAAQGEAALQARAVADYIAGMTDRFAVREHERLTGRRLLA